MDSYVTAYPSDAVEPLAAFAFGTAFFPVGSGLWRPGAELSERPIAFVAHVFDGASYRYALGRGGGNERIDGNRTWLGLRRVCVRAGVALEETFLTNALMGAKTGLATGAVRGGPRYRAQCAAYLARQLTVVRPRLVVALGAHAMGVLGEAVPAIARAWCGAATISALDASVPPRNIVRDIRIATDVAADVAVLRHPCTWTNAPRRGCRGLGLEADAEVLSRALVKPLATR